MNATIETQLALQTLNAIIARIEDPVPLYDAVGAMQVRRIKERIMHTKESPEGEAWAPWERMTREIRTAKGNASQGLLWDTGHLLRSIHADVDGAFEVNIGTDDPKATELQEGRMGAMSGRPFIGWSPKDTTLVALAAADYIMNGSIRSL